MTRTTFVAGFETGEVEFVTNRTQETFTSVALLAQGTVFLGCAVGLMTMDAGLTDRGHMAFLTAVTIHEIAPMV